HLQVLDVEQGDARQLADALRHVAGHGQVDDGQRAGVADVLRLDHRTHRAGGGDQDVDVGKHLTEIGEGDADGGHPGLDGVGGEVLSAVDRAVGDGDVRDAVAAQVRRGEGAHGAGAQDQGALAGQA